MQLIPMDMGVHHSLIGKMGQDIFFPLTIGEIVEEVEGKEPKMRAIVMMERRNDCQGHNKQKVRRDEIKGTWVVLFKQFVGAIIATKFPSSVLQDAELY